MEKPSKLIGLFALLCLTGCSENMCRFKPYDYDKHERAKLSLPRARSSVDLDTEEIVIKRKIPLPLFRGN